MMLALSGSSSHMCPQARRQQKGPMHIFSGYRDNCPISQLSWRAIATEVIATEVMLIWPAVLTSAESPLYVQLWGMLGAQKH